jgi:hypothetical protein
MLPGVTDQSRRALRRYFFSLWQRAKKGERLEGEDKVFADLMQQHDEYHNTWEFADQLEDHEYDAVDTNPFVHIAFDAAIVNQVTANEPRGISSIYDQLRESGRDHLEAVHDMAQVFVTEFYEVSRGRIPYSDERYLSELKRRLKLPPSRRD